MKALYTSTAYLPSIGGAQYHIHSMAKAARSNFEVSVASFWNRNRTDWLLGTTLQLESFAKYAHENISVYPLTLSQGQKLKALPFVFGFYGCKHLSTRQLASDLKPQLKELAKDASFIHNARIGREPITWASWEMAKELKIPFILSPYHHPRWMGWNYRVYHDLYRKADAIAALTQSEKKLLIDLGVSPSKIALVGVKPELSAESHPENFKKKFNIQGPLVLFLGQKFSYKGWQLLWDAMQIIWKSTSEAHVAFIGPRTSHSKSFFKNVSDARFIELGHVDLQMKTDAIAACDVLCLPSSQESFGIVFIEAWSFKKPVIGCRIPAVSELITDGEDGFLVNSCTSELAEKISYLIKYPSNAKRLGENGWQKVQMLYSEEKFTKRVHEFYEAVLDHQPLD